jgi:hypothetical protein
VLSRLFRGKFLAYFKEAYEKGKLIFPGKIAGLKEKSAFKALLRNSTSRSGWSTAKPLLGVQKW